MEYFNEYTLYHGWMLQYLAYLKWYCEVVMLPCVTIKELLEPPVYTRTWFITESDESDFQFGLWFRRSAGEDSEL